MNPDEKAYYATRLRMQLKDRYSERAIRNIQNWYLKEPSA